MNRELDEAKIEKLAATDPLLSPVPSPNSDSDGYSLKSLLEAHVEVSGTDYQTPDPYEAILQPPRKRNVK